MFQGHRRNCYLVFLFWFVFLFCKLLWRDLGDLVSVMECNLGCSMEILYELCESRFYVWIGADISGERNDREKKNIYGAN